MGIITPDSTYEARLGFNFKLQFIPNTQNYVITDPANVFEAVSIKDNSVSRADCIEFTPIEQTAADKKEGIYYAYAKVTKAADDIRIRPKCSLVPKVINSFPSFDNTNYPQDTSIKINFNKAVNLSDFADENGFLKNITITSGDVDLLDTTGGKLPYYKSPYLEDDGKTLVIPIVKGNYLIKDNSTKDISVSLKLESLTDGVEGENAAFIQKSYDFTFRIDSKKDTTPPILKTLRIARTEEDARNGTNLIIMDEFTHYADNANYGGDSNVVATNIQNHHVNKVWVYFEGEDADSGVAGLEIREQLIRTTTGEEIQGIIYTRESSEPKKQNFFENPKEDNTYSACVEYNFNSDDDGVVKLDFVLHDRAGKTTTYDKPVDIVKDTLFAERLFFDNPQESINPDIEEHPITITVYTGTNGDDYYIKDLNNNSYSDTFYSKSNTDFSESCRIISFEYGYDQNNLIPLDLKLANYEITYSDYYGLYSQKMKPTINADPRKTIYLKTTVQDAAGNICSSEKELPAAINIIYSDVSIDNLSFILKNDSKKAVSADCYYSANNTNFNSKQTVYLERSSDNTFVSVSKFSNDKQFNEMNDGYYSFLFYSDIHTENGQFIRSYRYSPVIIRKNDTQVSVITGNNGTSLTIDDVPDFEVKADSAVPNSGNRTIHIKYKNFIPKQGLKYLIYYEGAKSKGYTQDTCFIVPSEYCAYSFKAVVVNEKNETVESSEAKTLDLFEDNIPPKIDATLSRNGQLLFKQVTSTFATLSIKVKDDNLIGKIKYLLSNSILNQIDWNNDSRVRESSLIEYDDTDTTEIWGFDIVSYDQEYSRFCYVYVMDSAGNYTEKTFWISGKKESGITVTCNKNGTDDYTFTNNFSGFNASYYKNQFISINNEKNTWELCSNATRSVSLSEIEIKSFILAYAWGYQDVGANGYAYRYSEPVYYCPQYLISQKTENPMECDLKNIYAGMYGYDISADQPCFAHTMYCPHNLGDTEQAWLNSGYETGLVMKKKSFTYSYDNTSAVPAGYYYTTIVHFADGDVKMTEVKQK